LLSLTHSSDGSPPSLTRSAFWEKEREVTTACLKRNPKAYGAWFHRKWSVRHYLQLLPEPNPLSCRQLMQTELHQCAELLNLDERNFHCWSYRRFVVGALASPNDMDGSWISWCHLGDESINLKHQSDGSVIGAQIMPSPRRILAAPADNAAPSSEITDILREEWNFTTEKIRQNFSNGSAFHHRSKLISLLYPAASFLQQVDLVQGELELIGNAVYTEPDDQTPWWYLRFVIEWADPNSAAREARRKADADTSVLEPSQVEVDAYLSMLKEQFDFIRELVEAEDGLCKWGLLGMNMIATILYKRLGQGDHEGCNWKEEAYGCLKSLHDLDPDRVVRYRTMIERYDCMVR